MTKLMTIAAVFAALSGCATSATTVEMDPMTFEVVQRGDERRVEILDPETLFREGSRAFQDQDFKTAALKFGLVVDRFPENRYASVSAYNAGMALLNSGRCEAALPRFRTALEKTAGSRDGQDALFQIGACQESLEDWAAMEATAQTLLTPHWKQMKRVDRIGALAMRGHAQQQRGRLALAERDYKAALELYRQNLSDPAMRASPNVSLAQYQIGEIYRQLFASIAFVLPVERMERDLEDKSNFFLKAQSAYLRTLRLQHPDHAVVAGFRLGALYEAFYDDMMAAEIPGELNREEVELYYEELKSKIRPMLVRAIDIYERNLRMGQRFGRVDTDWVRRTEASLARLKEVLAQESSRDAAAQLRR